jgi:hypothetical protein
MYVGSNARIFIRSQFSQVNKKLGKTLAGAIETGEQAAETTKDTLSMCSHFVSACPPLTHLFIAESTTEEGKQKAGEAASFAGQKKNEVHPRTVRARVIY